jgi:hypothetical protein
MDKLDNILNGLTCGKRIVKTKKTEIEELCNELDKMKYDKLIEALKNVILSRKYTKKLRDTIEKLKEELIIEEITDDKKCDLFGDTIKEIENINVEKILDTNNKSNNSVRYNKKDLAKLLDKLTADRLVVIENERFMINDDVIIKITNEYEKNAYIKHYEYLLVKESHRHIESMKDKEISLSKLDKEISKLDKEIELKKLEFDIIKFKK